MGTLITVDPEDLVTPATIARRFGLTRATVSAWTKRYPDFPAPVITADDRTKLYSWREVRAWNDKED